MELFQVLHIPTNGYITSFNRDKNLTAVVFSTRDSAEQMIQAITYHHLYIAGAPLTDFQVGGLPATSDFCVEEFECIPVQIMNLSVQRPLSVKAFMEWDDKYSRPTTV